MKKIKNNMAAMQPYYALADRLMNHSDLEIKDIFNLGIDRVPNRTAFIYEENGKSIYVTFTKVRDIVKQYAMYLSHALKDIKRGEYIALKLNNSARWVYSFYGLLMSGYKVLLINPILNKKDTERLIKETNSLGIIIEEDNEYDVKVIQVSDITLEDASKFEPTWENEIAFSTSGTTGDSRVYCYTGKELCHQLMVTYEMPYTTMDIIFDKQFGEVRHLAILPFSHIFGFVAVLLIYFFFGMSIVFLPNLSPKNIQSFAIKYKVTHIFGVPLLFDSLKKSFEQTLKTEKKSKQDLVKKMMDYNNKYISATEAGIVTHQWVQDIVKKKILGTHIRYMIAGGSVLSKETLRTINGLDFPLYNGYGMTEIGVTSVELSPSVDQRNKGSIGKPLYRVEYKIINGELLVKGPEIHSSRFVGGKKLPPLVDEEGYFHTGDIAEVDGNGYYYIKGKLKDVIIGPNGENIYPEDLEVNFKNIPYASNIALVDNNGELTLVIELEHSVTIEEINEMKATVSAANDSLPKQMRAVNTLLSKEPFPMNASLKLKRYELTDKVKLMPELFTKLDQGVSVNLEGIDKEKLDEILEEILPIFADISGKNKEEVAPNSHFILDLGGDSFTYMNLVGDIEEKFEIEVPTSELGKINTPLEFAVFIYKSKQN